MLRVLEPSERISEILFGLIMVLGFTGSVSVAQAGNAEIRTMLLGALGCNLAWGIIDGVFYLMATMSDRGRGLRALRAVRSATDPEAAQRIIAQAMPPVLASVMEPAELERIHQRLIKLPEPPGQGRLRPVEYLGALYIGLLVFLSTFPVVIPFLVMREMRSAIRVSNTIAVVMLFLVGYAFGRYSGRHPVASGLTMVAIGLLLVALTVVLGG